MQFFPNTSGRNPNFQFTKLGGAFFFTFHTVFISRRKWTKNAYLCQIFLPKRGQLSPFCIRIAWQHRSLPKIWILPPCFDSDGQSVAADESGVVNLLILGISCSFTRNTPISKREGSSTHWFYDQKQKPFFTAWKEVN